ncbi:MULTISPECIES: A24 family peptidase [unclassified Ensifer]|uniref:prepilin peptidase n=1 Tax=unclassified Ensifer TaxID=2633371 RepID=UPI0007C9542D|nr:MULTISPECIES: A24 family peptidase [unclassified Ensifer]
MPTDLIPFGYSLVLAACTVVIFVTDFRAMVIPDWTNIVLLLAGILGAAHGGREAIVSAVAFGCVIFALFWIVRRFHYALTGRVGLGMGDVKFAGVAAVWLSPLDFPLFLLLASLSALVYFFVAYRNHSEPTTVRVPFGPFLAASLLGVWHFEQFGLQLMDLKL